MLGCGIVQEKKREEKASQLTMFSSRTDAENGGQLRAFGRQRARCLVNERYWWRVNRGPIRNGVWKFCWKSTQAERIISFRFSLN